MDQSRINAIRARCEAATPGPWEAGRKDIATIADGYESKWIYAGSKYLAISSGYEIDDWDEVMSNAYFISNARTDIPDLIAEIARLRAELEAANARWEETASDGTDYTLTHSDGIYAVADSGGHVLCEFMRGVTENGGAK